MNYKLKKITDNFVFISALKATVSALVPIFIFTVFGMPLIGFTIAIGAILTYPSDLPVNLKHKVFNLILTSFTISGVNLLINIVYPYPWIFYPVLTFLIFSLSMLSVFGQRAIMFSFAALLSMTLSFSQISTGKEMFIHSSLLLLGGLFYTVVSLLFFYFRYRRYAELQIAECFENAALYLKLKSDLWDVNSDRTAITKKQLLLQVKLNELNVNISEIILHNKSKQGASEENKKLLLLFILLEEVIELAISTSFNHFELHKKFDNHAKVLKSYQNLAYSISNTIDQIATSFFCQKEYESTHQLKYDLNSFKEAIDNYEVEQGEKVSTDDILLLNTLLHYAQKQTDKINKIELNIGTSVNLDEFKEKEKELERFVNPVTYSLDIILDNISFSSIQFRHALRLTITILVGFIIGDLASFHNPYWIILTILVIMRQEYGLTKKLIFQRIFGTILGALIAMGILTFTRNIYIIGTFSIVCLFLGFMFTKSNYKIAATFITLNVVLVFGLLTPNINELIQYRILDTLVGATLVFLANYFLWPSWELMNISSHIEKSILANRNYLKEILIFYNAKGVTPSAYKSARKKAFIEIGNLMTSFQKMLQEPKSKQTKLAQVYKLTTLNHSLLSNEVALYAYIQSQNKKESTKLFNEIIREIITNLDYAIFILRNEKQDYTSEGTINNINNVDKKIFIDNMETNQLNWLIKLSEDIIETTKILIDTKK